MIRIRNGLLVTTFNLHIVTSQKYSMKLDFANN